MYKKKSVEALRRIETTNNVTRDFYTLDEYNFTNINNYFGVQLHEKN